MGRRRCSGARTAPQTLGPGASQSPSRSPSPSPAAASSAPARNLRVQSTKAPWTARACLLGARRPRGGCRAAGADRLGVLTVALERLEPVRRAGRAADLEETGVVGREALAVGSERAAPPPL